MDIGLTTAGGTNEAIGASVASTEVRALNSAVARRRRARARRRKHRRKVYA